MRGIFGIFNRDGAPPAPGDLETLRHGAGFPAGGDSRVFRDGPFAAGMAIAPNCAASDFPFLAAGRIDNRVELAAELGLNLRELTSHSDFALMRRAWDRWGEAAPSKLFGDWSFAAWDAAARTLFLARDHSGNTALYYHDAGRVFAFASSRRALLALHLAPIELDELYLARLLVSWTPSGDRRTIHAALSRLPPAHTLQVTPTACRLQQYWRVEALPEFRLPRRADYIEAFQGIFETAVRDRLRGADPVASMLSGGLDSGAVAATAAALLAPEGRRLTAFTSVPLFATRPYVASRFENELPLAQATAAAAGNIDLHTVDGAGTSPIEAVRRMLEITLEPQHAAGNTFWILEINRLAAAQGCRVLLTGQMGNGGVSWPGDPASQPAGYQIRRLGISGWLRRMARRQLTEYPFERANDLRRKRASLPFTAIHPAFARRIDIASRWADALAESRRRRPLESPRCRIVLQGLAGLGAIYSEMGAAAGIEIRDPTADPRVLAFALSVPDRFFIEPATGLDRWLIREAMRGRLPDPVRLNRARGRQSGDIVSRLRASAGEVEDTLSSLSRGRAADYLDIPRMRHAWAKVQAEDTFLSFRLATTILMRGIMAGLFIDGFTPLCAGIESPASCSPPAPERLP